VLCECFPQTFEEASKNTSLWEDDHGPAQVILRRGTDAPHSFIQSSNIITANTRDGFRVYGLIVCEFSLWDIKLTPPTETTNDRIYDRGKFLAKSELMQTPRVARVIRS
jgi:hypothetical protein